jgi:hypothetical protein
MHHFLEKETGIFAGGKRPDETAGSTHFICV